MLSKALPDPDLPLPAAIDPIERLRRRDLDDEQPERIDTRGGPGAADDAPIAPRE
jgi:hypothetical protein